MQRRQQEKLGPAVPAAKKADVLRATQAAERSRRRAELPSLKGQRAAPGRAAGLPSTGIAKSIPGRFVTDLASAAYHAPGGVYGVGKAGALDVSDIAHGRVGHGKKHPFAHTGHLAKLIAAAYVTNYRHPIRYLEQHPGNVGLDVFGIASAGAGAATRVGAAGEALRAGEGVGVAATRSGARGGSLLHRPEPRTVEVAPGVHKLLSRNPLRRQVQKVHAGRVRRAVEEGRESPDIGGRLGRKIADETSAQSRVGRELRAQRRIETDLANANSGELRASLRGLSKGEHSALGVVGIEGVKAIGKPAETISRHIRTHEQFVRDLQDEVTTLMGTLSAKQAARSKQLRDLERAIDANREHVQNLRAAGKALANPSPRFLRATETAHRTANATELESIRRGLVSSEHAVGRRAKVASIYHGEELSKAPVGSFYFPLSKAYTERFRHAAPARGYTPQMQATGLAKPTPGRYVPGAGKPFTGRSVKLGGITPRIGEHIADVAARRNRLFSAQDFHERLKEYATPAKESADQVPLRETTSVSDELKRVLAKAEERALLEPGEGVHLHEQELRDIHGALTHDTVTLKGREVDPGDVPIGTKIERVQWVDRRYLKDMDTLAPKGEIGRAIDDYVNRPYRFLAIYARPSYALNWLGNLTMLAVTEGKMLPRVMHDAQHVEARLGSELTAKIDAGVGTTRTASYLSKRSRAGKLTHDVTNWWQRVTDQGSRRAAFFGEARRAGYTGEAGWTKLLTSDEPAIAAKRVEVFRRARKNIVDFDSMTPAEQQLATYVFVYPWLTRGSAWAVHASLEHPVKTATLASIGEETHKDLLGRLKLPEWLAGAIPIHIGGNTFLVNPSSINTFATAADVGKDLVGSIKGIAGLPSGQSNLSDVLSPAAELGMASAGAGSGQKTGLAGLVTSLPIYSAGVRAGLYGTPPKTYPYTSPYEGVTPLLGGMAPRQADTEYLAKQAEKEELANLTTPERARVRGEKDKLATLRALRAAYPDDFSSGAGQATAEAFDRATQVDVVRAQARADSSDSDGYTRAAYAAEIALVASWEHLSAKDEAEMHKALTWSKTAPLDDVKAARRYLTDHDFEQAYLEPLRDAREALKQKGKQ
jgi:hypothetical protein